MNQLASMTGFARADGSTDGLAWVWELRSVNGRGLDLRFRLPPGWDALEPGLREAAGRVLKRGNVSANLTLRREAEARLALDAAALEQALAQAQALAAR
ncbi:MAG TPA: YicC/YloC family endoribonuclease, partial [Acetobacteraceae bacterium]|nr:YicC/YloC family endoribonuclease [Acetobacteraceae bacterium]